jgi:hypothetical protein
MPLAERSLSSISPGGLQLIASNDHWLKVAASKLKQIVVVDRMPAWVSF